MKIASFILLFALIFAPVFAGSALAGSRDVQDSYYFMKDDGEFSDDEKDAEAQYIYQRCTQHSMQSLYFDCSCIAGAFRLRRDDEKLIPQDVLFSELLTDRKSQCANTAVIAGKAYEGCMNFAKTHRYRELNNEQYCSCVGNTTAKEFAKNPHLKSSFIVAIKTKALLDCEKK